MINGSYKKAKRWDFILCDQAGWIRQNKVDREKDNAVLSYVIE